MCSPASLSQENRVLLTLGCCVFCPWEPLPCRARGRQVFVAGPRLGVVMASSWSWY